MCVLFHFLWIEGKRVLMELFTSSILVARLCSGLPMDLLVCSIRSNKLKAQHDAAAYTLVRFEMSFVAIAWAPVTDRPANASGTGASTEGREVDDQNDRANHIVLF